MSTASQQRVWMRRATDDLRARRWRTGTIVILVVLVHAAVYAFLQHRAGYTVVLPIPAAAQPVTIEFAHPAPTPQVNPVPIPTPAPPTPQPKPVPAAPRPKPQPQKQAESKPVPAPAPKPEASSLEPAAQSSTPTTAVDSATASRAATASTATTDSQAPLIPATPGKYAAQNPQPNYPMQARKRRMQGEVILSVQVDAQGAPLDMRVQRSSGYDMLDNAALEAVKRWRFEPAQRGGQPQTSWKTLPLSFRLN